MIEESAHEQLRLDDMLEASLQQQYHQQRISQDRGWMKQTDYLVRTAGQGGPITQGVF